MIYIVKQWRYKWNDSYVFELDATYKVFQNRGKAVNYIKSDIYKNSLGKVENLESIDFDNKENDIFDIYLGKYGDKYQIIETELN